jgi:glycine cleavage system H protein
MTLCAACFALCENPEEGWMQLPGDLLYTKTHEWVRDEGSHVTIGLTDFAQNQLKDIVYVELPAIGSEFKKEDNMGVVESVKTAADIFSPVTGRVREVNGVLKDSPQFVNEDPYGKGWMIRMELKDRKELKTLLSSKAYEALTSEES